MRESGKWDILEPKINIFEFFFQICSFGVSEIAPNDRYQWVGKNNWFPFLSKILLVVILFVMLFRNSIKYSGIIFLDL